MIMVQLGLRTLQFHWLSTYKFERQNFRTGRRIAPKFGTHVPIATLTLIG